MNFLCCEKYHHQPKSKLEKNSNITTLTNFNTHSLCADITKHSPYAQGFKSQLQKLCNQASKFESSGFIHTNA